MSRFSVRTIIAACLLGLSPAVLGGPASAAGAAPAESRPWSQDGADEGRSQWLRGETQLTVATARSLQPEYALARTTYGYCSIEPFRVAPVTTPSTLVYEDSRNLRAVDLVTGDLRWRVPTTVTGDEMVTGLAIGGGKVIVGLRTDCESQSDPDGSLKAYDAATGRLVWSTDLDPGVLNVAVSGGTVLVYAYDAAWQNVVIAYSLRDGTRQWIRRDCGRTSTVGLFAVAGKVATTCGVLDIADGTTLWTASGVAFIRGDAPGRANPQLYGQLANGSLVAYRPDGTRAWTSRTSRTVLAAGPGRLIVGCAEGSGVCAIDRATGARVWRHADVTPTTATLIGAGLLIVNGGQDDLAEALNAADGEPVTLWYGVHSDLDSKFQASNGRLIVELGRVLTVYAT